MSNQALKRVIFTGLFLIPFVPFLVSGSLFFPFITTKAFVFRTIVEIIFGAWILLAMANREYRPQRSKVFYALGIFLVVIGVADLFGMAPVKSFWSNFERMEGYITLLHLGALYLVMGTVFRAREWRSWWNTSLAASVLMIVYCLFQLAGVVQIHQGGVRVDGTLGNAAYLALYFLIHIFVASRFVVKTKDQTLKWMYGALILFQVLILYLTATRGAILGLLGGVFVIAVINIFNKENMKARQWGVGALVALVVLSTGFIAIRDSVFVKGSPVLSRLGSISLSEWKTEGRSFVWAMALKGIKEKPLLGWGQDNFNYVFAEHYSAKMFNLEPWFDRAHNIFLDWGVSGGLLGLGAYLSLYVVLLMAIWTKSRDHSFAERSVLTGLLAAYFFNNVFVFDNLVSYVLFIALLAEFGVRHDQVGESLKEGEVPMVSSVVIPILVLSAIYYVNLNPLIANTDLIKALKTSQASGDGHLAAIGYFKDAYNRSRLGRPETVEWISSSAQGILSDNQVSMEARNDFFIFAVSAMESMTTNLKADPRYEMVAGAFYLATGQLDQAEAHFNRAKLLMPEKQQIYFQLGQVLYYKKDYQAALEAFKQAYELAPEYDQAKMIYQEALKQIPH